MPMRWSLPVAPLGISSSNKIIIAGYSLRDAHAIYTYFIHIF
jgi:hypothetical protein